MDDRPKILNTIVKRFWDYNYLFIILDSRQKKGKAF